MSGKLRREICKGVSAVLIASIMGGCAAPAFGVLDTKYTVTGQECKFGPEDFESLWDTWPLHYYQYEEYILQAAREQCLDPNLIAAVITVESGGDPNAVSNRGAIGIMQVMPYESNIKSKINGRYFFKDCEGNPNGDINWSLRCRAKTAWLNNVQNNIRYASWILRKYIDMCEGDLPCALEEYYGNDPEVNYSGLVSGAYRNHHPSVAPATRVRETNTPVATSSNQNEMQVRPTEDVTIKGQFKPQSNGVLVFPKIKDNPGAIKDLCLGLHPNDEDYQKRCRRYFAQFTYVNYDQATGLVTLGDKDGVMMQLPLEVFIETFRHFTGYRGS